MKTIHCSSCGKEMMGVEMRCPACRTFTPAFWLNTVSAALLAIVVAVNYVYIARLIPIWEQSLTLCEWGMTLEALAYAPKVLARMLLYLGPALLLLAFAPLWVLRWEKKVAPYSLKSGKLLAGLTLLALVVTATSELAAFAHTLWTVGVIRAPGEWRTIRKRIEYSAIEAVERLNVAEAAYRQKNPRAGFTCNLKELEPYATFAKTENVAEMSRLFQGAKDQYEFRLESCAGEPSKSYRIVAEPSIALPAPLPVPGCSEESVILRVLAGRWPVGQPSRTAAFCSDETGTLYFAADGKGATCLSRRTPLY